MWSVYEEYQFLKVYFCQIRVIVFILPHSILMFLFKTEESSISNYKVCAYFFKILFNYCNLEYIVTTRTNIRWLKFNIHFKMKALFLSRGISPRKLRLVHRCNKKRPGKENPFLDTHLFGKTGSTPSLTFLEDAANL